MANVRPRERLARIAITRLINGMLISRESSVHEVESSFRRKGGVVAGQAGRQDAIENVDAARHAVDQIFRRANTHQVAGFIFGQKWNDHVERVVHLLFGLANGESADGDAGGAERSNELGRLSPQVRLNAALHDPE